MTLPRVLTEPLGGSPLSLAMQRGKIPGIERPWPQSGDEWKDAITHVRRRFASYEWFERLAPAFGSSASISALAHAAKFGVVVTTGQQPGLFGGPMLTLVKALSARAFADALERATGVPTATVFWAATDDADFAEAASVVIPATGAPATLTISSASPAGTPMTIAPLSSLGPLLGQLESSCGSSAASMMSRVRTAYRDGNTVGNAYVELLRDLLTPWGIAVLDASHPAVRGASRPLLKRVLDKAADIEKLIEDNNQALRSAGLHPQVEPVRGLSLAFTYDNGVKRRIPIGEARRLADENNDLGTTVLVRPIVEAFILPTVAYVGGPGEVAYFAQIPPIAELLEEPRPVVVPRWSTTIVEPSIDRVLDRYGVKMDELRDLEPVLARLVRQHMPADIGSPLESLRNNITSQVNALAAGAAKHGLDGRIVEGLKAQLALRLDRGERRVVAALKHREGEMRRDLGTARASLYPNGIRQERALSFIPLLARYGDALVERMLVEAARHADQLVDSRSATGTPVATNR